MRFGKIAGFTASALVASAMSIPALAGSAQAAPTSAAAAVNQDCTVVFGNYTMVTEYKTSLAISADGTNVTVPASAAGILYDASSGAAFPNFKMESITATVNATINGEAVTLTGTTPRANGAGVSLGEPLALPGLTGTRVQTADVTQATVNSVALNGVLWVPFGGPSGARAPVSLGCAGAEDTEIKQALRCTFEPYAFTYPAVINVRTSPMHVRVQSVTGFVSGMPAIVPVSKIVDNFNVDVAGTDLVAKGVANFDPAAPGNTAFTLPPAFALRSGTNVATSDVAVTGATLVMTSGADDNPVPCVTTGWPTVSTLVATSPVAATVDLAVTIDEDAAVGTVSFKEGATVVGTADVEAGVASTQLTGVKAGSHSYTAEFTPTDPADFAPSTSPAVSVVVAPTQPCIDSTAALPGAEAGVTNANAAAAAATASVNAANAKVASATKAASKATKAAKTAAAKVTKANKAVKKAKSKKAKTKAKKALAKVKKANTKAKKAVTKAKSQVKTAKAGAATAAGNSAAANARVAAATAALTAAQNAVAANC